jgi:hypothetical protein
MQAKRQADLVRVQRMPLPTAGPSAHDLPVANIRDFPKQQASRSSPAIARDALPDPGIEVWQPPQAGDDVRVHGIWRLGAIHGEHPFPVCVVLQQRNGFVHVHPQPPPDDGIGVLRAPAPGQQPGDPPTIVACRSARQCGSGALPGVARLTRGRTRTSGPAATSRPPPDRTPRCRGKPQGARLDIPDASRTPPRSGYFSGQGPLKGTAMHVYNSAARQPGWVRGRRARWQ